MTKARSSGDRSRPRRGVSKRDLAKLLRQARQVKEELTAFQSCAEHVVGPLGATLSDEEVEAMASSRANLHGTLENLLNQDLGPVLRQLDEVAGECQIELDSKAAMLRQEPASTASPPDRSAAGVNAA
jgi:hypothetical protein